MDFNEFLEPSQEELDVQKAVVESLAADKAEQDEQIAKLNGEISELKSKLALEQAEVAKIQAELAKNAEILANNTELSTSNQVALLDRDPELQDRFEGETREHLLEVIKLARDQAEKEGRIRRAQLLESILLTNESTGALAAKREYLNKLFADNGNIVSGPVMDELNKLGISYKHGEEYLLPSEILNRTY